MKKELLLASLLVVSLLVATAVCYGYMADRRSAADTAAKALDDCRRMSSQMESLSRRPALAAERERVPEEVAHSIEAAAKAAGVNADRITRISPEPPQRIGDSAYKEKPTVILLKNVTVRQLAELVHHLLASEQGLRAKSFRLTAPSPEDTGDLWNAELTITYLIYEPTRSER